MSSFMTRARRLAGVLALSGVTAVAAGCASISTQQEAQLGAEYAAEINRQLPIVQDQAVHYYINQLGNSIARRADTRGLQYQFFVVNADEVNAFAVPGGYIYLNRGLIERAGNVSELAGVLAHEIGHVVERHSIDQLEKAQNANTALSVVYGVLLGRPPSGAEQAAIQVGGGAVFASYTRDAEREADQVAVQYLVNSGIHPGGMVTFFQKLLEEQRRAPSQVEQWFATHPTTQERITNTQQMVDAIPSSTLNQLTRDSQAFQQFRQRVSQLPAAPRS